MSKYKDRYGNPIKLGNIVLQLVSLNIERQSKPYTVHIIKKKGNRLILDGDICWGYLSTQKAEHLCVLTLETDMRKVFCDFARMQDDIRDGYRSSLSYYYKYLPDEAYKDLEKIAKLTGFKECNIDKDTIKDIINTIDLFFSDKEINEKNLEASLKILKEFEQSVSNIAKLGTCLFNIREKRREKNEHD